MKRDAEYISHDYSEMERKYCFIVLMIDGLYIEASVHIKQKDLKQSSTDSEQRYTFE